jgi:HAMP domain-containing protein
MRRRGFSLRARVMLWAGLALATLLIADAIRRDHAPGRSGRHSLAKRAALLVSIQAKALSVPMWNVDHEQVGVALDALMADPDFVASSVLLPDSKVFEQRHVPAGDGQDAQLIAVSQGIMYRAHDEWRAPGTLNVSLSTLRLNAALRRASRTEAVAVAMLLNLVLLILYFTLRQIVRPLDRLAGALTRLASGDRDTPIPASDRDDEVGAVARGLEVFRDTAFRLVRAEGAYRALRQDQDRSQFCGQPGPG